jgi:hypothetical protein
MVPVAAEAKPARRYKIALEAPLAMLLFCFWMLAR